MQRGHEIKCLDHGYVRLVDYMGTDESIVEAARMSTGRGFVSWEPYKRCKKCDGVAIPDGNRVHFEDDVAEAVSCGDSRAAHDWQDFPRGDLGILDYLYRMRHSTPFEMCELIIDVQVPMDCWRQWIRHRTASVNEYSTRYSEAIDLMAKTPTDRWRTQGLTNRQGSGEFLPCNKTHRPDPHVSHHRDSVGDIMSLQEAEFLETARQVYKDRLAAGVAKEQARKDLPLSTYTAARWKCDLKNVLHFLGLRMHPHAQVEIRTYAHAVAEIAKAIWPRTYGLFEEYDLHGVHLSRTEAKALAKAQVYSLLMNHGNLDEKTAKALVEKLSGV